ncbi:serine/threonine protein kinase BUD32 [Sporobolomyces salmoneus]|uniref:serine/threonine protein kinase BUD32 n=1 Tax=Sporobolomyces salmoneus TaxID=183962 RepID=UPI0031809926
MPSLSKEVKSAVDSTRMTLPLEEMLSHPSTRLIKQGAEAKVYRTILYPSMSSTKEVEILVKHRFPKRYRHPTLDAQLTRQRLTSEARALVRCLKAGVKVPGLRIVDVKSGALGVEWIEGWSVREVLGGGQEEDGLPEEGAEAEGTEEEEEEEDIAELLTAKGVSEDDMLRSIGAEIAKMHIAEIIHGDLTTSNMMVRLTPNSPRPFEIVLIDFGLSSASLMAEDRAVDLYVLERAFASTHPVLPGHVPHFDRVLEGYEKVTRERGKKGEWERTEKRLEEVRMRGRKRSMVG